MIKIWAIDYSGEINLPENLKLIMPGDSPKLTIKLSTPVALKTNTSFAIKENGKTIGSGKILRLIE
jgi:elongation factor Tu